MRLLQQFFEALEKLVEERDKKDGPELQLQLQSIYRAYFNHPSTFYYDQDAEYILNEMGQNYGGEELLTRIDMLSELLYQDALLKESEEQKYLLRKSLFLLNYLDTHSDTFSFERRGKIGEIEKKIGISSSYCTFFQRNPVFSCKIVDKLKSIPIFAYRLITLKSVYYGEN